MRPIRRKTMLFAGCCGLLLVIACASPEDIHPAPSTMGGQVISPKEDAPDPVAESPFFSSDAAIGTTEDLSTCFSMRLQVPSISVGDVLAGGLVIVNSCGCALAVLTAPVERRERFRHETRFPVELGNRCSYAIAYIFRQDVGLPQNAFLGDGCVRDTGLPDYAVIGSGERRIIPLTSGEPLALEPGAYGISILTIVAPKTTTEPRDAEINLRMSAMERHRTHPLIHPATLSEATVRRGPATSFEVFPKHHRATHP